LGILFFLISIGSIKFSFFHIIIHALFKSLLFIRVGRLINDGSQDLRIKSGSLLFYPFIYSSVVVSLFSLISIPFRIGFYSKDLALDFIFRSNYNLMFYFLFLLRCLITIIYSFRIIISISLLMFRGFLVISSSSLFYLVKRIFISSFCTLF